MSERLFARLLASLLRFFAGDPARWLAFRRQLLRVIRSDDAEQSRAGALAIASELENMYTQSEES